MVALTSRIIAHSTKVQVSLLEAKSCRNLATLLNEIPHSFSISVRIFNAINRAGQLFSYTCKYWQYIFAQAGNKIPLGVR